VRGVRASPGPSQGGEKERREAPFSSPKGGKKERGSRRKNRRKEWKSRKTEDRSQKTEKMRV
jgi:hypothetical protein